MAGYSGTPLIKKLGIKEGLKIFIHQSPETYFDWISPLPKNVTVQEQIKDGINFIHLFASDRKSFEQSFKKYKRYLAKDGMLWVSWPKKSSKISTDLDEDVIRDFGLQEGLVDVKVCAVNEVWSGLKFVIRIKDR